MMAWIAQTLDVAGPWLVEAALRVTVDGALVALPVWLACRFVPLLPASARTWLWWGVSLKLLLSLTGAPSLSVPVLPSSWSIASLTQSPATPAPQTASRGPGASAPGLPEAPLTQPITRGPGASAPGLPAPTSTPPSILLRVATAAWAVTFALQLVLLVVDAWRLRRLVARAQRPAPAIEDEHEDLAKDLGLRAVPALRESADVTAPQVVGVLRPTVLLPLDGATPMTPRERAMVLCHELAHVRRGDLILGWIPALAARALTWHPLARLAAREYALAREAACDALVLRTLDTPPRDYGRLLVRLGVHAPAARIAAAGTSPTAQQLRRRLHMLQHASLSPRALTGVVITAVVVALVPLRLVAIPAIFQAESAQAAPVANATSTATVTPRATASGRAETAASPQREPEKDRDREESWVYLYAGSDNATMHGDSDDMELARRLRGGQGGAFFLFRRNGEVFTIDDRTTLERVETLFEPQRKLGEQQGELGARQGELGLEQGKLGERQARLGQQQGELGLRQAEINLRGAEVNARQQRLAVERMREPSAPREARERVDAEVREQMRELDRQMRELSERHDALGREQEALGREQEKLGEKQAVLGAEQEKLGEQQERAGRQVERELRELVDRAVASGIAKRAK
jgi:beta-lactamase regulating signal transducer with metallopeptidase domain